MPYPINPYKRLISLDFRVALQLLLQWPPRIDYQRLQPPLQADLAMLYEYPTTRCSRKCHISGRPIQAGESYVSALVPMGNDLVRIDIAADQWKAAPEGVVGWWKCRMPDQATAKLRPAPVGVLLDTLTELVRNPKQAKLAYLLALILVRRRVLTDANPLELHRSNQPLEALWHLTCQSDGRQWDVPIASPKTYEEAESLRRNLMGLLFSEE